MPAISKIRLTNVVYEDGDKRFNDEIFLFDGHNGAILLENGGGKTVFIHTLLQAILPHTALGDRKIKETLQLENAPAHIGIEWITNERPRRYVTTAVSLFLYNNKLDSHRYVFEYEHDHPDALEQMPFVKEMNGSKRPAYKEEMADYYSAMKSKSHNARTFDTIGGFHHYLEEQYQIITNEWESIVKINKDEGGIEKFFENCRTTTDLFDRLLIPTVEDSIAGHEQGMFADMFEKQREGFQTYRNLQKSMQEHQAIQQELDTYVAEFEAYSKQQAAYEAAKQRAKGLAQTIRSHQMEVEKELAENEEAWGNWRVDEKQLNIQTASYDILQEQEKARVLEQEHLEKLTAYEEATDKLQEDERSFHSLQHAQYKQEIEEKKQLLTAYKAELKSHDEKSDVHDYEAKLEEENAKLHGLFLTELEQLETSMQALEVECRPITEAMNDLTEKMTDNQQALEEKNKQYNHMEGQLTTKETQQNRLKQQLLANPDQEDVQTQFDKWAVRHQWLDEEIIHVKQKKKTLEQQQVELQKQRESQLEQLNILDMEFNDQQRTEQVMQEAHNALIEQLATIRPSWKAIDDLHLKENAVYGPLVDLEAKLAREREDLLDKERLARRFVDDYDKQETFFSDPFLAEKLSDWQNQLYVVTGPDFVADLPEPDQNTYAVYPLWPSTLVTTETDKTKLHAKLNEIKNRLQYPIAVVTLEEAIELRDSSVVDTWIAPSHWETNLNKENFNTWKDGLQEAAARMTSARVEKEEEMQACNEVLRQFERFFHAYPIQFKEKLKQTIRTLQAEKESGKRTLVQMGEQGEQLKRAFATAEDHIGKYEDEKYGLESKMEKATEFFQVDREITALTKKHRESEQQITSLKREARQLKREYGRYEEEKLRIDEQRNDNKQQIRMTQADTLYNEVKTTTAIYTDEAKTVMMERRRELEMEIHGIRQSYDGIVVKHDQTEKDVERLNREIETLVQIHEHIDRDLRFPVDGENLLERYRNEVKTGKVETEKLLQLQTKAKEAFVAQQSRVSMAIEQFQAHFSDEPVYKFSMETNEISGYLTEKKDKITERNVYLQAETTRLEKKQNNIEAAFQQLDRFSEAHHFNSTLITAILLTEKEIMEFTYDRLNFVQEITSALREKRQALEAGKEKIDKAKQQFRSFCRRHISERKLREMATEGLEVKTTYEEVLEFQQNMLTTVERADQYARNYISEKDKEVQAFINSIHNHLVNVTEQLRVIPKKTKVKVGDQWKEIFQFTIPEWTEEDGKIRIRQHMDWILEQLESDRFKNDHGLEDSGKVRKEVEAWLHTKQLLQVVMEHKGMKASCRKVTNDNEVTRRLTSWEQSNQWSGGEKWSKNMTLFLGILNFVAEKKQHIQTKMKRHRAVILDNPFGKASSDHVLSPVFFIAEQLGFQIIALTAHADGKFLQDYFPIIYSLKLRASRDEGKQIMTKEKSLHHAYFQDHEPAAMERLAEREQMELF